MVSKGRDYVTYSFSIFKISFLMCSNFYGSTAAAKRSVLAAVVCMLHLGAKESDNRSCHNDRKCIFGVCLCILKIIQI